MTEAYRQSSGQRRDISSKTVLENPVLYAQFLRDNIRIPCLQNVQPEDIEDVSERYRPYLGTEFESDTVKRIRIRKGGTGDGEESSGEKALEPLFLVSLTEHKSWVDYDVSMQLLKYMLCIWIEYGKEMKQQYVTPARKGFRYPVIIPVVYYEGKRTWTAQRSLLSRISQGELFRKWIPDFTYEVVSLHDYSNEELIARGNEMSLIMLFNKIQDVVDIEDFLKLPGENLDKMVRDTPEVILDIIVSVMESLCGKIGATEEETRECVSKVKERRMGYLFENMEKMDIQAERRNTAQARAELAKAREEAKEVLEKVQEEAKEALENAQENAIRTIVNICRKTNVARDQIICEIMSEYDMDRETAQQKVDLYWET